MTKRIFILLFYISIANFLIEANESFGNDKKIKIKISTINNAFSFNNNFKLYDSKNDEVYYLKKLNRYLSMGFIGLGVSVSTRNTYNTNRYYFN